MGRCRPRNCLLTMVVVVLTIVLALQMEGWEMVRTLVARNDGDTNPAHLSGLELEQRKRSLVSRDSNHLGWEVKSDHVSAIGAQANSHNSSLSDIIQSHEIGAKQFLANIDNSAMMCASSQRCPSNASMQTAIYPPSIHAYRHPFGSCSKRSGSAPKRVPLKYSQVIVGDPADLSSTNFTRFWPLFPDLRTSLASEHERCHFVMARMLAIVASVLNHYNMTNWFITHATLLGAVREGGFIPWDADVDIAMPRSHLTFLRKRWRREFPRDMFLQSEKTDTAFHMWNGKERAIRIKDRYSNFPGMRFSVQKGSRRYKQKKYHLGAHVDIIPLEKRSGKYKLLHSYFDPKDVYPLGSVCFENMQLPAPRNVSNFLRILYGDDYLVPPNNATFGGPTVLPCLATQRMRGNPWSLSWATDHTEGMQPRRWPRNDPDYGTFLTDFKTPHRLYYNSKW